MCLDKVFNLRPSPTRADPGVTVDKYVCTESNKAARQGPGWGAGGAGSSPTCGCEHKSPSHRNSGLVLSLGNRGQGMRSTERNVTLHLSLVLVLQRLPHWPPLQCKNLKPNVPLLLDSSAFPPAVWVGHTVKRKPKCRWCTRAWS